MTSTVPDELSWDPFDTEIDTAPYEIWRRLRDEAPVYRNDELDFYALSRFADVLEAAWRHGARFDAWSEHLNWDAWQRAIAETGFDVEDALRERSVDERLPWDHFEVGVKKAGLIREWERAQAADLAPAGAGA